MAVLLTGTEPPTIAFLFTRSGTAFLLTSQKQHTLIDRHSFAPHPFEKAPKQPLLSLPNEKHANILYFPELLSDSAHIQSVRILSRLSTCVHRPFFTRMFRSAPRCSPPATAYAVSNPALCYFVNFIKKFIKNLHNSEKGLIFAGEVLRFI